MTARHQLLPGDGDLRHGTVNGYSNLRCRCERCRAAWTAYVTLYRLPGVTQRRAAQERGETYVTAKGITHGLTGYQSHSCRCDVCRRAKSEDNRRYRERAS